LSRGQPDARSSTTPAQLQARNGGAALHGVVATQRQIALQPASPVHHPPLGQSAFERQPRSTPALPPPPVAAEPLAIVERAPHAKHARHQHDRNSTIGFMDPDSHHLEGGCHCGAVRFRIRVRAFEALACNCSICSKKGMINLIVRAEDFELRSGADELATYQFNTGTARHHFCKRCGIHPFSRPRSHPDDYDVNARCLDDGALARFTVRPFDGQNWEASVGAIR
jgi:hypothetical protein